MNLLSDFGKRRPQREEGSSAKDFWGTVCWTGLVVTFPLSGTGGNGCTTEGLLTCLQASLLPTNVAKGVCVMPGSLGWENWSLYKPVEPLLSQSQAFYGDLGRNLVLAVVQKKLPVPGACAFAFLGTNELWFVGVVFLL